MKKSFIWAMAATLVAGAAFAGTSVNSTRYAIQPNATFATGAPATTNNDDSCDITVSPAATLLLPHFTVDYRSASGSGETTLMAITNTSNIPQIAHVTIWTDWSYPVLDFNIFLTGYDVQTINLYDIISRGLIPATSITGSKGSRSAANTANPNFAGNVSTACAGLPGPIGDTLKNALQQVLTTGSAAFYCGGDQVGGTHTNAEGYVTVDVANTCSQTLPSEPSYYSNEILFDNTLIGDWIRFNPNTTSGNYAGGNPMVHIKAVPEGGAAGTGATNLPYTFYSRYTPTLTPVIDRRQPLPALFAARYINGGTGGMNTNYAIWREGVTNGTELTTCNTTVYPAIPDNGALPIAEVVRFDEAENPQTLNPGCRVSPCQTTIGTLPETSATPAVTPNVFPPLNSAGDLGGWMYMNLDNGGSPDIPAAVGPSGALYGARRPSQNWVTIEMTSESRFGVDFDAAYLGNGCSGLVGSTGANNPINPYHGVCAQTTAGPCLGTINTTP